MHLKPCPYETLPLMLLNGYFMYQNELTLRYWISPLPRIIQNSVFWSLVREWFYLSLDTSHYHWVTSFKNEIITQLLFLLPSINSLSFFLIFFFRRLLIFLSQVYVIYRYLVLYEVLIFTRNINHLQFFLFLFF